MALRSRAFAGDPKLEAAAVSDPDHILRGARGDHVTKIQQALILVDGASIQADGDYGPATAAAVLAYKRKRNIINPAYQTQADDIVGKMTMAALDADMLARQTEAERPARLQPIFPRRSLGVPGFATLVPVSAGPSNFAASPAALAPRAQFDTVALDIQVFGVGSFRVTDGVGGTVNIDPSIAVLFDPKQLTAPDSIPVTEKSQVFNVRGIKGGLTLVTFIKPFGSLLDLPPPIMVIVRDIAKKPRKVPQQGTQHDHQPSGKWPEIRKDPQNSLLDQIEGGSFASEIW